MARNSIKTPRQILAPFPLRFSLWKILIDDPDFTRLHLNRVTNRTYPEILFAQGGLSECVVKNSETLRTIFGLGFLQSDLDSVHLLRSTHALNVFSVRTWNIVSSIDGLFLLQCRRDIMLWNPSIRKTLPLPPIPAIPSLNAENAINVIFGIGFDPLSRDYKVVTKTFFACWQSSIPFKGVLYGFARDFQTQTHPMKLVSFDLRSEVFASFELPVTRALYSKFHLTIVDHGCSLALVHDCGLMGSIWTLEMLGDDTDAGSWIQRYTFDTVPLDEIHHYDFLCIKKNGEMLIKWYSKVICYNLETRHRKIKNVRSFEAGNTVTYMESLLLNCKIV